MQHKTPILTQDLGSIAYPQALDLQRKLNQDVIDGNQPPTVLLLEHLPVITLTRRPNVRQHLIADPQQLEQLGVQTHETDRGGDITYHGPGQLVVYPILKLADFDLNLSSYMRLLEQVVIDTLATWGIAGQTECGATGVWVDLNGVAADAKPPVPNGPTTSALAKICAMGVRIRKNTTLHGLALNINPDMSHFELIVPCGLEGRPVTSLKQLLGDRCPSMQQVKDQFVQRLQERLAQGRTQTDCTA